jgi:hypothetical protein
MNKTIGISVVILLMGVLFVSATSTLYTAEAKSKASEIKVYVDHIKDIASGHTIKLKVCMADDDGCFGKIKSINLQHSTKSKILAGTFTLKGFPNPDPSAEFGIGDVSACGRLTNSGVEANDCAYGNLKKVKTHEYKATIDFMDLVIKLGES